MPRRDTIREERPDRTDRDAGDRRRRRLHRLDRGAGLEEGTQHLVAGFRPAGDQGLHREDGRYRRPAGDEVGPPQPRRPGGHLRRHDQADLRHHLPGLLQLPPGFVLPAGHAAHRDGTGGGDHRMRPTAQQTARTGHLRGDQGTQQVQGAPQLPEQPLRQAHRRPDPQRRRRQERRRPGSDADAGRQGHRTETQPPQHPSADADLPRRRLRHHQRNADVDDLLPAEKPCSPSEMLRRGR